MVGDRRSLRRALLWGTLAGIVLFATGIAARPAGVAWDRVYDVVLYNLPYLPAAAACWVASWRVRSERLAWRALAVALLLNASGNGLRTFLGGVTGAGPTPPWADLPNSVGYLVLYVTLIGMLRARVPRFHPSMWLDGLIGALGTLALGVAFLIGPFLSATSGHEALGVLDLAWPAADLLLLALVVGMGAILGVRLDRTLGTITAAMAFVCAADIVLFLRSVDGRYHDGGPLELIWLAGIWLVAYAAVRARPRPLTVDEGHSRTGWRLLALPLICNLASLVVLAVGWSDTMPVVAAWLAIACITAALTRTAVTFREVRAYNEVREQARTDELTGLPNRRALR